MRRDINIRKRKRILLRGEKQKNLIIIFSLLVLLIICLFIYIFFIKNIFIKKNLEKDSIQFSNLNENIPFTLNKIILFSSATAKSNSVNQSLSLDISQFCDIGIYLNNTDKENVVIQSLYINDISISAPEFGTPYLYKKHIDDLGKCSFTEESIIGEEFAFNIIDNNMDINYENFELLNNGTTPISLGFYNKDIKKNFIINKKEFSYNGTLLKTALIPQSSLNCTVSFCLNIITTNNEHYVSNISFDIPFSDEDGSIYDTGYSTKELKNTEIGKFIRIY